MAYVSNFTSPGEDDEQKSAAQGPVSPTSGGSTVQLSSSSGVGTGGSSAGVKAPSASAPAGGQFASLNQYIGANQGQAQPLADKITSGIQGQYDTLQQQNQSTLQGVADQSKAGTTADTNNLIAQESANPVSFASNPGNVTNFQNLLSAQYTGPTSAEGTSGYQNQQAAINSAISEGQAQTSTDAGRQQLLTTNEAKPTAGVTALNSAILSESPEALGQVENAYQPFSNLLTGLSSGATGVDAQIAANQAATQQANQASNASLTGQATTLNNGVQNEVTAAQDAINNYNTQAAQSGTAAQTANTDIQTLLSQYPQLASAISTNPLSPYLNLAAYTGAAPTAGTAATAQDYATAQALEALGGANAPQLALDPTQAAEAGTALSPQFNSLVAQLNGGSIPQAVTQALQGVQGAITKDYAPLQNVESQREAAWTAQGQVPQAQTAVTNAQAALTKAEAAGTQGRFGNIQTTAQKQAVTDAQTALKAAQQNLSATSKAAGANGQGDVLAQAAATLGKQDQWIPGAATAYNNLLTTLNQTLAPVQGVSIPNVPSGGSGSGPNLGAVIAPALNLQTLGIPTSVLSSIGNDVTGALKSIGSFFGSLF